MSLFYTGTQLLFPFPLHIFFTVSVSSPFKNVKNKQKQQKQKKKKKEKKTLDFLILFLLLAEGTWLEASSSNAHKNEEKNEEQRCSNAGK